ncbi:MAG: hypothetical protein R2731_03665 [Nocardioides sp.]
MTAVDSCVVEAWPEAAPESDGAAAVSRWTALRLTFQPAVPSSNPPLTTRFAGAAALGALLRGWLGLLATRPVTAQAVGIAVATRAAASRAARPCRRGEVEAPRTGVPRCRPDPGSRGVTGRCELMLPPAGMWGAPRHLAL